MDPTAVDLLQFVPTPPNGGNLISTVPTEAIRGDQFTAKIDHRINDKQNLSVYYYFNDDRTITLSQISSWRGPICLGSEAWSRSASSSGTSRTRGRSTAAR